MEVCKVLRPVVRFLLFLLCLSRVSPAATKTTVKPSEVVVDVVVTDEFNRPAKGLGAQEFQLFENGKRQKLEAFEEHVADTMPLLPAQSPQLPPNTFTNAASSTPNSISVILLDQLNTSMNDQQIGIREVADFISKKPADAAFAIFVLRNDDPFCSSVRNTPWFAQSPMDADTRCSSIGKLLLVQGITQDKSRLLSALDSSLVKPHQTWLRPQVDMWTLTPRFDFGPEGSFFVPENDSFDEYGYSYGADYYPSTPPEVSDTTMTWLAEIGHFLQNLPGRKSLIWISDSFDAAPMAQYVEYWFPPKFKGWERVDPTSPTLMTHLAADRLNLARVALYPVDLTGKTKKIEVKRACTYRPENQQPTDSEENICTAHYFKLNYVSSQLGGATFHGGENVQEALARALDDESHYYTLTYSSTDKKFDAKVRNLKITVRGNKYQLAYRRRYWADDPSTVNRPVDAASPDTYLANHQGPVPWKVVRLDLDASHTDPVMLDATRWGAPELNDITFSAHVEPTDKLVVATPEQMEQLQNYESFRSERAQHALEQFTLLKKAKVGQAVHGVIPDLPPADPTFVQPFSIDYYLYATQLRLLDMGGGKHEYRIEVALLAFDDAGKRVAGQELTIAGTVSDSEVQQFRSSEYHAHQTIELPERATMMRLALRDVRSGRLGSLEIPIRAISSPYNRKKLDAPSPAPQLKVRD